MSINFDVDVFVVVVRKVDVNVCRRVFAFRSKLKKLARYSKKNMTVKVVMSTGIGASSGATSQIDMQDISEAQMPMKPEGAYIINIWMLEECKTNLRSSRM